MARLFYFRWRLGARLRRDYEHEAEIQSDYHFSSIRQKFFKKAPEHYERGANV